MAADEDDDLIGFPGSDEAQIPEGDGEPSIAQGDLSAAFLGFSKQFQSDLISRAVRADPTIVGRFLFPGLDDKEALFAHFDLKERARRDAVEEAYKLYRASKAEQVWPKHLQFTVEQLQSGALRPPEPTVGGLLYPGRVSTLYGSHTAGKTWTALWLAWRNYLDTGGQALLLDYEDSEVGIAARCLAMTGDDKLAEVVHYLAPSGVVAPGSIKWIIDTCGVTLVILDSVGESMAASGYDSNSEKDTTSWFAEVPDGIAALGPAVLVLDHIAKRQDGTPMPVGSFRKSAAVTGAQFALENKQGFSRNQAGWSRLTCTKDRNGYFATGQVVGRVNFRPDDGRMHVDVTRGDDAERRGPNSRMGREIVDFVQDRMDTVHGKLDDAGEQMDGRPNITQIRAAVKGHNDAIKAEVDALVLNGWLLREHIKSGKTTRDVYVPGDGGFGDDPDLEDTNAG